MNGNAIREMTFIFVLACAPVASLNAQTNTYDAAGRLIRVAYPDGKGVSYTYDDSDDLLSATVTTVPLPPTALTVTRTSPTEARIRWEAASADATGYSIMRRTSTGGQWETIATVGGMVLQYVDLTLDPALEYVYRVASINASGTTSAYTDEIFPSSASAIGLDVNSRGAGVVTTLAESPTVRTGYARVDIQEGSTPYGTALFRYMQGGTIVSEAAVPASPPTLKSRIFIDYRQNTASPNGQFQGTVTINTGFAIVNPGSKAAEMTLTLRLQNGVVAASGTATLNAGQHFARFIDELPAIAPGFVFPPDFAATDSYGTLDIESSEAVSVMALRMTTNQRGESLFTSTPVADLSTPQTSATVYFPQFADGGGYVTSFILLNTSNNAEIGTLDLRDNNGAPIGIKPVGLPQGSSFTYTIPANGSVVFETDGSPANVQIGWARWIPDLGRSSPVGSGIFRFVQNGTVVSESGIPSATPTTRARIYVDKSAGRDTGVAIASVASNTLTVSAYGLDGSTSVGSPLEVTLPAAGHDARLAGELIPELPAGFRGVLDITSPTPFVALTLRLLINARSEVLFTTFPVADQTRAAPEPAIFPQVADGGGYETELILLGPVSATKTLVRFYDDQGLGLPVGKLP